MLEEQADELIEALNAICNRLVVIDNRLGSIADAIDHNPPTSGYEEDIARNLKRIADALEERIG